MADCGHEASASGVDGPLNGCRVRFKSGEISRNRLWTVLIAFLVGMVATLVTMAETKASRGEVNEARKEQTALLLTISGKVDNMTERLACLETTIKERDRLAVARSGGGV